MHARSGLKTEYLGDEWFSCVRACCEEAKKLGLKAWCYDENGWPSGFVGGKLLENKQFRLNVLRFTQGDFDYNANYHYKIKDGKVVRINDCSDGVIINAFIVESVSQTDVMDGKVVDAFIQETHERYKKEIAPIADNIVGFFTDEPRYSEGGNFPYSKVLHAYYLNKYGEDIFDSLGLLAFEGDGYEKFRYRYYKCCQELFLKNYAEKLYDWHVQNGLKITGHYIEERTMFTQMLSNAGIMPYYEFMQIPGIDWLCRRYLSVSTIRQLTSVTEQLQKEDALSEMYAMSGWDVTPKELKNIGDYQYNYGITLTCQHLLPYSEKGERKNDFPVHFSSFNAWIDKGMFNLNQYFDALGEFIRSSKENVNVGVLFTVRSIYLKYDVRDWSCVDDIDKSFIYDGCQNLANHHVAFHILDETLLGRHGGVDNGRITLGACAYDTLLIPKCYVIDKTTDDILRAFVAQGGKVHLLDCKPHLVEGEPSSFDYLQTNVSLDEIYAKNEYHISSSSKELHTSMRTVNGVDYVFAVNTGESDIRTKITVGGVNYDGAYNVLDDSVSFVGEDIIIPAKESVIACKYNGDVKELEEFETIQIGSADYTVTDFNANYFALDKARLSYDGVNYDDELPVVGIFRKLLFKRYHGKVYLKHVFNVKELVDEISVIAEDVDKIRATLNGCELIFDGQSSLDEIFKSANVNDKLVVGENQLIIEYDFYQNDMVYYALFGEDVSESIRNCMTYDTMITSPFLCGKFGVFSNDFKAGKYKTTLYADNFYLSKPPKTARNLVEQGFTFFAGNITLKRTFTAKSNKVKLKLNGRYHLAEVFVNGNFVDMLEFSNVLDVSQFSKIGENQLEIKLYSGNRNLLGPHHSKFSEFDMEISPFSFDFTDSWKDNGSPDYTDYYSFSKFGLFDL